MIFCSQCGSTVEENEQFCSECGTRFPAVAHTQASTLVMPASSPAQAGPTTQIPQISPLSGGAIAAKHSINPIVWLAIPFGLLVIVILTVISFSASSSNKNSSATAISNSNTAGTARTEYPGLPNSFQRNYQGTIGSNNTLSFGMTLIRSGRDLRGTASTGRSSDALSGTIETDGRFRLEGYENGTQFTGIYTGQVNSDGTVTGSWVTPTGQKETPFFLRQQ